VSGNIRKLKEAEGSCSGSEFKWPRARMWGVGVGKGGGAGKPTSKHAVHCSDLGLADPAVTVIGEYFPAPAGLGEGPPLSTSTWSRARHSIP
jgi:hypothetical protein